MGGEFNAVSGRTKLAAWKAFEREMRRRELLSPEEQEVAGLFVIFPENKKEAFRQMKPSPDGEGWILEYHLHT